MAKIAPDDYEALRVVVEALQRFDPKDQERLLRWAREKLGLASEPVATTRSEAKPPALPLAPAPPSAEGHPRGQDIRTFMNAKQPASDRQFAAAVAYYYRFEAPDAERKESITADDLQEATRRAGRDRIKHPVQTLVNAHNQGYLDRAGERGAYTLSTVGENLVAMALPSQPGSSTRSNPRGSTRKSRKVSARRGAGAKAKNKK
jgi:hypothetical protein